MKWFNDDRKYHSSESEVDRDDGDSDAGAATSTATTATSADSTIMNTNPPLKKAKYAWQIKSSGSGATASSSGDSSEREESSAPMAVKQHGDLNANFVVDASNGHSSGMLILPARPSPTSVDGSRSTVSRLKYVVHRWQSKQLAQGIIDNAINRVLGELGVPPYQSDSDGVPNWGAQLYAEQIENDGVVEAIRQRGLRQRRQKGPSDEVAATSSSSDTASPCCSISEKMPVSFSAFDSSQTRTIEKPETAVTSPPKPEEELLDTAVSCAISQKGLESISPTIRLE